MKFWVWVALILGFLLVSVEVEKVAAQGNLMPVIELDEDELDDDDNDFTAEELREVFPGARVEDPKLPEAPKELKEPVSSVVNGEQLKKSYEVLATKKDRYLLVFFFSPRCGSCLSFEPTWKEFESIVETNIHNSLFQGRDLRINRLDCSQNLRTCDEFEVQGYPTIRLYHADKTALFSGERTVDALIEFAINGKPNTPFSLANADERAELREASRQRTIEARKNAAKPDDHLYIQEWDSLSDDQIDAELAKGWWLVEFHIGGGFALDMQTTFRKIAETFLKDGKLAINFAKIDVLERTNLHGKFNLRGFPQLSLFDKGNRVDFISGVRDSTFENISAMIAKHVKPSTVKDEL